VKDLGLGEWTSETGAPRPQPGTVAGPVSVRIDDRQTLMDCLVGPPRTEPVVGSTVLAVLDLVADEATGTLRPRRGVRI